MEKVAIELKANYHIVLHSVAGVYVMKHIFKTFEKPSKFIKVTLFHGMIISRVKPCDFITRYIYFSWM